ncbi:hypothetical protein RDWZM_002809 [Blomia tropicalis]|uniref:Prolactin regulatory element-binding protein n=1 Tax=Blomia tropicalis TaxID=40697 RepID=A0A9Q0MED7_BLOTA|nr:hypothetical protein BLOT_001281 [Blomia tropicalis]KAJ6224264.1 hypothetical protein RDWZM_002809 [Blomia tropicalis]
MSNSPANKPTLLARLDFPPYCMKVISERHILVAGGGGASKTGIPNCFDIYELTYDPLINSARVTLAARFDNEDRAIMNLDTIFKSKYHFELLSGGSDGSCYVHDVKLKLSNEIVHGNNSSQSPNEANLRRRHFSFSTQQKSYEEDVEENIGGGDDGSNKQSATIKKPNLIDRRNSKPQSNQDAGSASMVPEYSFDFVMKTFFQTDFKEGDPYQKLIKYSPSTNMVYSAGAEGVIRFWSYPDFKEKQRVGAHENDVDDMDVHPGGTHLISVSRDGRNNVWNAYTGQLVATLIHDQAIPKHTDPKRGIHNVKYIAKRCRYGTVEGDDTNVRLFLILNPAPRSNFIPSYIAKWHINNDQYRLEKISPAGHNLTSLGISDNGQFLSIGSNDGDVDVYISFSLQRCYHVSNVHKFFVSSVEFLPSTQATLELIGDEAEVALVSVSGDNQIVMHKIPRRATLSFCGSFAFFVIFMLFIYIGMNYMDL